MTKRAPIRIWVIAAISLWALTGLLPARTASASKPSTPAMEQVGSSSQESVRKAVPSSDLQRQGDPDDLLQGGSATPQPGSGSETPASGPSPIIRIIVDILNYYLAVAWR